MNPALRKIIEGIVGIVAFIVVLRLFLVPAYAFIHSKNGPLMIMFIILGTVLSLLIAYKIVRYIHRHL